MKMEQSAKLHGNNTRTEPPSSIYLKYIPPHKSRRKRVYQKHTEHLDEIFFLAGTYRNIYGESRNLDCEGILISFKIF